MGGYWRSQLITAGLSADAEDVSADYSSAALGRFALSPVASVSSAGRNRAQIIDADLGQRRACRHPRLPFNTDDGVRVQEVPQAYEFCGHIPGSGRELIHLVGRAESLMDEILDATGNRFAAADVWSGNELVGSRGVFCNPDPYCRETWPGESWDGVRGARGDTRDISSGVLRASGCLDLCAPDPEVPSPMLCLETT